MKDLTKNKLMAQDNPPRPFVKWVGGKRQIMEKLLSLLPDDITTYVEPFVGGGALMWEIAMKYPDAHIVINDFNEELINVYQVIRDEPERLLLSLRHHKNDKNCYYTMREMDRQPWYPSLDPVSRVSRFIYLNKTGYNGLWRVNKQGQCNVPFGKYKSVKYDDRTSIMACSQVLKRCEILHGDFEEQTKHYVRQGAFYYLDPPYIPLSKTSNFTGYTGNGFDMRAQERLKDFVAELDNLGAYFMLSNSHTPEVAELYDGFDIVKVTANRLINSASDKRSRVCEVIVKNF